VNRPEQLRTLGRRIDEIHGAIVDSCQILAYCAANSSNFEASRLASNGLLDLLGQPDGLESNYALTLSPSGVEDVICQGKTFLKKESELKKAYAKKEMVLSAEYNKFARSHSILKAISVFIVFAGAISLVVALLLFHQRGADRL
jgi:hypothetical protein